MKVKELIRQLKEFDPEARVFADSEQCDEILCSFAFTDNGNVVLEHAGQFDVKSEIGQMLDDYLEDGVDETDAYTEMCDKGFTPDVVSWFYDKWVGEHMKKYCEEHGIDY